MHVTIDASLPFPLRIVGGPFPVAVGESVVQLSFETRRHEHPDERVHGGGSFDFEEDRYGWASFTEVTAQVEADNPNQALQQFIAGLNTFISCLRDVLGLHWIHPVEPADLFQLTVSSGGAFQTQMLPGRTGAVTLPVEDLLPTKKQVVLDRVKLNQRLSTWRSFELDAHEALAAGRYEQCAVLAWSAVESGVRSELPHFAREAGLTPSELNQRLGNRREKAFVPLSHEQVVEESRVLDVIRICAELAGATHDPGSLAQSARMAYDLRNRVAHQGYPVSAPLARQSLDATQFILRSLSLPTWRPRGSFETDNWTSHFGSSSIDLNEELAVRSGRLVLFGARKNQDALRAHFELRVVGGDYIATVPPDIDEPSAAVLLVLTAASYRPRLPSVAFLRSSDHAKQILVAGLLDQTARDVTQATLFAYAAVQRADRLPVRHTSDFALRKLQAAFAGLQHSFETHDARFVPIAVRFASLMIAASPEVSEEFVDRLRDGRHADLAHAADSFLHVLDSTLGPESAPHAICDALRGIHDSTLWLDSIVVICPEERLEYGTSARPLA